LLLREFGAREIRLNGLEDTHIVPGMKTIFLPCINFDRTYFYPIYLLNGRTYFKAGEDSMMFEGILNNLSAIRVNEIKRLMVLPPGKVPNFYAHPSVVGYPQYIQQSMVVIETYSRNTYRGDPDGIKTFIINGLDAPRIFYSPRYEDRTKNSKIYDGRATLYWNPEVRTDQNGQAKVEFYTGDRRTTLDVFVNGIEPGNGNTGQEKAMIYMDNKR
jgi:hypothetical protein